MTFLVNFLSFYLLYSKNTFESLTFVYNPARFDAEEVETKLAEPYMVCMVQFVTVFLMA